MVELRGIWRPLSAKSEVHIFQIVCERFDIIVYFYCRMVHSLPVQYMKLSEFAANRHCWTRLHEEKHVVS